MHNPTLKAAERLVAGTPVLEEALRFAIAQYAYEGREPLLILVYAELGDAIASKLGTFSAVLRKRLFDEIEIGVSSPDDAIGTAFATGLVEALVTAGDKAPELWQTYQALMGPNSLKHAIAWRDWGS